jgi:hypothetical protein
MMKSLGHACSGALPVARSLFLAASLGVLLVGCKGGGGSSNNTVALPVDYALNLWCLDEGININTCVLDNPNNPFANSVVNAGNKFDLYNTSPSAKTDFYIWATALARSRTGENQYYTALSLHDLFSQGGSQVAREQAKRAYRSQLDNFFDSVTFFLGSPTLDLVPDQDFVYSDFGSGSFVAGAEGGFTGDADFTPVWSVPAGNGYGQPTALIAFAGFNPGFASPYLNLVFKIKDLPTGSVWVLFADGGVSDLELQLDLATYATDIPGTTGWKQVEIPLSLYPNLALYDSFAIQGGFANGGTFLMTDVGFTGDAIGGGLTGDVDGNGFVYLYRSGEELQSLDLKDLVGRNLYDPGSQNLLQLFINQADAVNALADWGYEYDPVTEVLSKLP